MASNLVYKCNINMSFIFESEYPINSQFIKYIIIENMYESKYMPIIYVSMSVSNELYTLILENEKEAKMYLSLERYNNSSNTSLSKRSFNGQFTYIVSNPNPNYSQEVYDSANVDTQFRKITIGLMSMDIMNKVKKSFNGIFGEIDMNTLILKALEGIDTIVKMPTYNPEFETIVVPALNSKTKLLEFLCSKCPFYDTNYKFFVDFNQGYLLDMSGDAIEGNDGDLNTVYIDINELTTYDAYSEGMSERDGTYFMNVNPANTNISINKGTDKIANQIVSVSDEGEVTYVDLEINNNPDSELKQNFTRGGESDIILYKNDIESNTIVIEVTKENVDSTKFTPNKEYIIHNYDDYADYNGKYTLLYKKELIKNNNGNFIISTVLGLRKVGNITVIGSGVAKAAAMKSQSAMSRYSTTVGSKYTTTASKDKNSSTVRTNNIGTKNNKTSGTRYRVGNVPVCSRTNITKLPKVARQKATTDLSIKRQPNKLEGSGA